MYKKFIKRFADIVISGLGIIILLVPMLVIALITVIDSPGPFFFKQDRVGIHKKLFKIFKVR